MGQKPNPKIGVIADSTLQRHVVCKAIEAAGYDVVLTLPPEKVNEDIIQESKTDVWLVDIEDEEKWSDFIVHLFESAKAPILLGEGNAPSVTSLQFQRWEKKIYSKLQKIVGGPVLTAERNEGVMTRGERLSDPAQKESDEQLPDEEIRGEPASNVWVLGASLGGPSAVKEFLEALPAGLPIAFLIAQHIDPGFHETLSKVWGRNCHFRFILPAVGRQICHGEIMIAPLEQVMVLNQFSRITQYEEEWEGPYSPCIDQVMSLMADSYGAHTGAILFSGMGCDGAKAAKKLQNLGISLWAQSAETCANSSMPDSARETGCVSYSGSPIELAHQLTQYIHEYYSESLVN